MGEERILLTANCRKKMKFSHKFISGTEVSEIGFQESQIQTKFRWALSWSLIPQAINPLDLVSILSTEQQAL